MNFDLTAEQEMMQKAAREYAQKVLMPVAGKYDQNNETPIDLLREMSLQGYNTMAVPEEYGGGGMGCLTTCLVIEELSSGCAGIATSALVNSLAAYPILIAGSDEQKKRFLIPLSEGKLGALCVTEPGAGSDSSAITTQLQETEGGYLLNGSKCFITNGSIADFYTVFATADRSRGARGLTAVVVEKGSKGLSSGRKEDKMGIRASDTADVIFEEVFVPQGNVLGRIGGGFRTIMTTFDTSRPMVGALALGVARAAYERAVKYAHEREQFGQSIGRFQLIQQKLADMAMEIEAARMLVLKAAFLIDKQVKNVSGHSAIAKAFASDMAMRVTVEALQVFGGYGYIKEYQMEKYMRDAKIMQIYEGTNEIQRLIIANEILKGRI
jgi:alkylation response protein AidB-like acyl-CoA dehydrogenase